MATAHVLRASDYSMQAEPLLVEREDISFHDVSLGRVRIEVTVRNQGWTWSQPGVLFLKAAPLGAFVAWEPLASMSVPALQPSEAKVLVIEVRRAPHRVLGSFSDVAPATLLTATARAKTDFPLKSPVALRLKGKSVVLLRQGGVAPAARSLRLPADPLVLLRRRNPHWAGNLNVFVGQRAVERHRAQALRVYPGRANLAIFFVGTDPDAYRFALRGEGAAWQSELYDMTMKRSLLPDNDPESSIREHEWVETYGRHVMILLIRPPEDCGTGSLDVQVEQRSTGREAIVEFSLDPNAAGPGCYVL